MSIPMHRLIVPTVAALCLSVLTACGGGEAKDSAASGATKAAATTAQAGTQAGAGERAFQMRCVSCHQANGEGTPGVFPPLVGSEFATAANVGVPIRVVIHGLQGPITVKGVAYNSVMPPYGIGIEMSDAELAAVLTYVRSSWGNSASAVTPEDVARERAASKDHTGAMTAEILHELMEKKH